MPYVTDMQIAAVLSIKAVNFYVSQYSVNWLKLRIKLNTCLYVLVNLNAKCYFNAEC